MIEITHLKCEPATVDEVKAEKCLSAFGAHG